ncbi:Indoleamine 2,3-dioxygenase [Lachnellula hyalina]|uniref:Indoleamine 2,3-dioxygenase n=1 Tax=Lachnellula hyalina TaxID=1316788 RepID=A0A8H8U266_9HELO|nr:Indoleamine 2,3-dioxygenase [Lachnellula hyalina]TVY31152.1 Indoleamine 2,3-dioxygenase [Lachnellula hyalina]
MGSVTPSSSFNVLRDTKPEDTTLPAFMVSTTRGFLPRANPIIRLPAEFDVLESILTRMPIKTLDGTPGLLATSSLGETVLKELPDLTSAIDKYKDNLPLQNALYRDYSFLASAYLLEPCHERFMKGEGYGLGRQTLPAVISLPISRCAELAGFKPFMEYAGSYALFNYQLQDPKNGLQYDNLRLIRAFEHGLDPKSSEAGFVLVHVDMVQNSGPLVDGVVSALDACSGTDRKAFNDGLEKIVSSMTKVNKVMDGMWGKSKPGDYTSFRTFIFGITSQSMFPNGVIYEGVSDEPLSFRGESGANDSMIPLCDNFLQITMPDTPLTSILQDFRSYRPGNHREFLEYVKARSIDLSLKSFALQDPSSAALYLLILNQVRDFRWRHWCFTREYILKKTTHPVATGGSPIVTWLPNQLQAVMQAMVDVWEGSDKALGGECEDVMDKLYVQRETLKKEVDKYCQERKV